MIMITLEEARAKLSQLLHQLAPGEEILITEGQQTVAKLVGQGVVSRKPRQPGSGKGKLIILEEVAEGQSVGLAAEAPHPVPGRGRGKLVILSENDEHLKDFEEYM